MKDGALHILVIDHNRIRASIIEEGLKETGRVTVLADSNGIMRRIVELDPRCR